MEGCRQHFAKDHVTLHLCTMRTSGPAPGQDKEASDLVALVEKHKADVQREKDSGQAEAA